MSELSPSSETAYAERRTPEVLVHVGNFFPWSAVVSNETLSHWVQECGADGMEWIAAGPINGLPVGPTHEVMVKPVSALQEIFGEQDVHGHVTFHPDATVWSVLGRKEDRYRPGQPLGLYHLALAKESVSREALKKMERVTNGKFPVVVFPPFGGTEDLQVGQGFYTEPYVQTQPLFGGNLTPEALADLVDRGVYSGVCLDTTHFREPDPIAGTHPFGENEDAWMRAIDVLVGRGVLKEVHAQPLTEDLITGDKTREEVEHMLSGEYDTPYGRMIRHLVHSLGFMGPYTTELNPMALAGSKAQLAKLLLPPNLTDMLQQKKIMVDYIKQAPGLTEI